MEDSVVCGSSKKELSEMQKGSSSASPERRESREGRLPTLFKKGKPLRIIVDTSGKKTDFIYGGKIGDLEAASVTRTL